VATPLRFTQEYKDQALSRVPRFGPPIAEVAKSIGVHAPEVPAAADAPTETASLGALLRTRAGCRPEASAADSIHRTYAHY
jgi:hypothetical protein